MTSTRTPPPVTDLSVAEAATLIGVSRARVYQRITGYAGQGDAGQPLDVVVRTTRRPGTKMGRQFRVPIQTAMAWRAERQANHLPVGPVPPAIAAALSTMPPQPIAPAPDAPVGAVGLPSVSAF